MNDLLKLITDGDTIITYIAPGFLLVGVFSWIIQHKFSNSLTIVIAGIVASTIERMIALTFGLSNPNTLILCMISVLVGYGAGILYQTKEFNRFLLFIKIHRTTYESIWDSAINDETWVCVQMKSNEKLYIGQIDSFNHDEGRTYFSLSNYFSAVNEQETYIPTSEISPEGQSMIIYTDEFIFVKKGVAKDFNLIINE